MEYALWHSAWEVVSIQVIIIINIFDHIPFLDYEQRSVVAKILDKG